jgi:hypothetical protein
VAQLRTPAFHLFPEPLSFTTEVTKFTEGMRGQPAFGQFHTAHRSLHAWTRQEGKEKVKYFANNNRVWPGSFSDHNKRLTKARIAAREGISRARVTQVMNLLRLPFKIQVGLMRPPFPLEIHSFSERSLRVLVSCGDEEAQTARWRELVQNLRGSADN